MGLAQRLARASFVLALLAGWQLAALGGRLPDYLPGPMQIVTDFATALGSAELYEHIGASLVRSVPGFLIGSLAGAALGLAAGISAPLERMLSPAVFLTYPVPKIVMLPIFMLWFGIGDLSKILIIALACFYPTFINAYYGARATPRILVWSARNMGADEALIFRRVVLPAALPLIFAGLRVGHVDALQLDAVAVLGLLELVAIRAREVPHVIAPELHHVEAAFHHHIPLGRHLVHHHVGDHVIGFP